ncbi:hypothetical protein DH2020_031024 [Rehmannia glutinosa]|uniref:FAD-binding FR-type domain-containing protein n=1 Tax=Rehmannia glutinosa TaxID=99300 RepID=A0ABR0VML7_REHGL
MDLVEIERMLHEQIKSIQFAIKLLSLVTFLGYIMIWIMMPTNDFWLHWLPHIHAKTDSTYFGQQGANILIYCFPILLIATLGCLYLHLDKYSDDSQNSTPKVSHFASWRQPVLVKGPLGIVSWTELSFLVMFVALLVWSFSAYVHGMFKNITRQSSSKMGEHVWEVKLDSVALMLGLVGNICLSFLFFPMLKWNKVGVSNVAGEVALLSGLAMWITSSSFVRRQLFELFFYTHHLYVVFVLFFVLHVGFSYSCIMLPGFYLFLIDRFLRFLQSQQSVRLISARVLPCQAMELNFSKDPRLTYNPSSIMFINVKSISKLQWHPFTVTSNCNTDSDQISIVIKSDGNWSQKLYEKLSSPTSMDRLEVSVEGPYSPTSTSTLRHDKLVLVSGDLTMLDLLLPFSGTSHDFARLQFQIQAYVTRDTNPPTDSKKLRQSIMFKPSVSDRPVSAVLGSSSWLWLGAIISSSFVIFLVLLGLVSRYYIYPIDRNTYTIYSDAARSMIGIVVLCVSVVIVATLAFVGNRKQNTRDKRQIQSTDTASPMASPVPESWERELENVPHRSFKQVTTVHYGERPNLKSDDVCVYDAEILSECEESNVGVLVSGPKKMRQDVAAICSSGSANTLHYESFSFNW